MQVQQEVWTLQPRACALLPIQYSMYGAAQHRMQGSTVSMLLVLLQAPHPPHRARSLQRSPDFWRFRAQGAAWTAGQLWAGRWCLWIPTRAPGYLHHPPHLRVRNIRPCGDWCGATGWSCHAAAHRDSSLWLVAHLRSVMASACIPQSAQSAHDRACASRGASGEACSCVKLLTADAQAKSSAPNGAANGTASKAKAGKVVFGATGNRLLDKQQANSSAKPPVRKPEVGLLQVTFPRVCL